ncbi:GSU2403 family nucleotidyltransferase fold protein [Zoogloea sp.]|uniref:GSU2403 family nucleotidyltransferase fold protein n=1 Tax=Zoogloea sp. TaxID=49181 RepID=UPI001D3DBF11|nr:GSU2403 family nucleotidyltransferase fold protein [Zoogloea sp.]MBK6652492.1 hypothetical protein [Zoogloea sp.]
MSSALYRTHELAYRTQYAEIKERARATGLLLPGTPGRLKLKSVNGGSYWYRLFYPVPGKQEEKFVCTEADLEAYETMRLAIEDQDWMTKQISLLRKIGFQTADKVMARVLVELHNQHMLDAGLVLVGTLATMAWLNELGGMSTSAHTQDIDLASHILRLAAPASFLETVKATGLPFFPVPGLSPASPTCSVKLPGAQGLRVDVLTPGEELGQIVKLPALAWAAQTVPFYDYLLKDPEPACMLAGGHCVPVHIPQAARFVWHKLYASTQRRGTPEKATKDRIQALTIAALLASEDAHLLLDALNELPPRMREHIARIKGTLMQTASAHPELIDLLDAI